MSVYNVSISALSNDLTSVPSLPRYQLGHRLLVLIATSVYENELRVA